MENFNIIGMERHGFARAIKESIYIRVKYIVKFNLPIYGMDFWSTPYNSTSSTRENIQNIYKCSQQC